MDNNLLSTIDRAAYHYKKFCEELGIDITKPDTEDTPRRIAKLFYNEFLVGDRTIPFNFTTFPSKGPKQLITETGIRWVSLCAHHHLPIIGYAHICYIPGKKIAGLSKIPRLVDWKSSKPSIQEVLTYDILNTLQKHLDPEFLGVKLIAVHECMACRGVKSYESRTHTNAFYSREGDPCDFVKYNDTRREFQENINEWYAAKGTL